MEPKELKELSIALHTLSKLVTKGLGKYASAAQLSTDNIDQMHKTFADLFNKYGA